MWLINVVDESCSEKSSLLFAMILFYPSREKNIWDSDTNGDADNNCGTFDAAS